MQEGTFSMHECSRSCNILALNTLGWTSNSKIHILIFFFWGGWILLFFNALYKIKIWNLKNNNYFEITILKTDYYLFESKIVLSKNSQKSPPFKISFFVCSLGPGGLAGNICRKLNVLKIHYSCHESSCSIFNFEKKKKKKLKYISMVKLKNTFFVL